MNVSTTCRWVGAAAALLLATAAHAQGTSAAKPASTALVQQLSAPPAPDALNAFYDDSHKDLHPALNWMTETNRVTPTYWTLYTEARIRLKLKDYTGAYSTAEHARQLALAASPPSLDYAQLSASVEAEAQQAVK